MKNQFKTIFRAQTLGTEQTHFKLISEENVGLGLDIPKMLRTQTRVLYERTDSDLSPHKLDFTHH